MRAAARRRCRRPDAMGVDPGHQCRLVERQVPGVRDRRRTRARSRLIKGQVDGIGTHPRLRASAADGSILIDKNYAANEIADVPAALSFAGDWLRRERQLALTAVGHRVVHGGPRLRPAGSDRRRGAGQPRTLGLAGAIAPAEQSRTHSRHSRPQPRTASGGVLRHRVSPGSRCAGGALRDPGTFSRRGRAALWLPRPVLRVHRRPAAGR